MSGLADQIGAASCGGRDFTYSVVRALADHPEGFVGYLPSGVPVTSGVHWSFHSTGPWGSYTDNYRWPIVRSTAKASATWEHVCDNRPVVLYQVHQAAKLVGELRERGELDRLVIVDVWQSEGHGFEKLTAHYRRFGIDPFFVRLHDARKPLPAVIFMDLPLCDTPEATWDAWPLRLKRLVVSETYAISMVSFQTDSYATSKRA